MIIDHQREKLVQTVVFFASRVNKLGKTKLFKLLYFFDFQHYRDTGRSVTGLDYYAWPMGPVPVELYGELDVPRPDWSGKIAFRTIPTFKGMMLTVRAESAFEPALFSRRELRLLEALAEEFHDAAAEDMVEATHLENMPWHRVWTRDGRKQKQIPYEYALRQQDRDLFVEFAAERETLAKALNG